MTAQLSAETDLGAALLEHQWWFVRLYTHGFDGADPLIGELLPPIIAEARALGVDRWFYMRYVDQHGPHVRLRVLGSRDVLDHLQRIHRDAEAQLADVLNDHRVEHQFIAPIDKAAWEGGRAGGVRASIYEPELGKYGGPQGLALAEELFEFSSDLGLWACSRFPKSDERAALAAILLHDVADSLLHGPHADTRSRQKVGWDAYWDRHLYWWTAELGDRGPAARDGIRAKVAARGEQVSAGLDRVAHSPGVRSWRRRWGQAVDSYLHRAAVADVERTPAHLAFHQGHMMLNRLGFLPREEAVLGVHARHWGDHGA